MFETVGVMAVSACILQMVYEKIEKVPGTERTGSKRVVGTDPAIP